MIEVYKILTGREDIDSKQFSKPAESHTAYEDIN